MSRAVPEVAYGHVVVTRPNMAAPPAVDQVRRRKIVIWWNVQVCPCYINLQFITLLMSNIALSQ